MKDSDSGDELALPSLVKNVVDGLGTLVAGHVKLARAELEASVQSYGRHVGLLALAGATALLGYGLGCVAAALALAGLLGAPLAFVVVGGAHLVVAGVAVALLSRRAVPSPLGETMAELDHTVSLLSADARDARRAFDAPPNGHAARERIAPGGRA